MTYTNHHRSLQATEQHYQSNWFHRFAGEAGRLAGKPIGFIIAAFIVLVWVVTGPLFGFSDTWQLVINTGTTIITFLMVFLSSTRRTATKSLCN